MTSPDRDLPVSEGPRPAVAHTTTNLKRWSVGNNRDLPAVNQIRAIHVYDFDNTLFQSPLPNPQVWNGLTIGFLQSYDGFAAGGWWHDPNLLTATGEGAEIEEKRAWEGWWNEQVVQLVQLSMQQKDALTVLLTGRSEAGFADIIKRIVASRKLEFDLICLKPEVGPNNEHFPSTIHFKEAFLRELMLTYCHADEIRVYEDRVKHVKAFREFFENANLEYLSAGSPRKPIKSEVVHVVEKTKYLDPVVEVAEVQKMINSHNSRYHDPALNVTKSPYGRLQIKRQVFFTGYLLSHADSTRLISTLLPTSVTDTTDLKYMANNVMISPRPATQAVLDKVGGMGKKLRWRVTGIAVYDRSVWAARVQPVDETEQICTVDTTPIIVLAVRKGARPIDASRIQTWQPVSESQAIEFDSVVGEKVLLRIEEESPGEGGGWSGRLTNNHRTQKRRFHPDTPGEDLVNPARDSRDHQANNHHPQNSARAPSPSDQGRYFRNSNNNDHSPRRGGGGSGGRGDGHSGGGRGRGSGPRRGRGGPPSGGSFRGRGRGGGGGRGYRFLDDHAGMEAGYDERPNGMNY